ncbi:Uncharacterized protein BP5553_01905 [Venustampulla echinocandica]|uniref:Auxiliary Activity family 9 catalytic domain-containing protein n=1 Tax=Venustampulla echinocandica TaxID=2656787 RepID=A0A370U2C2_9HELO|nr:Uncharacterized protein BP5553_01905 [Venustampulla echinocandica]RDL41926.1 Uncharacterized protein BP5553_01905 [Venustampulla echinocandica]
MSFSTVTFAASALALFSSVSAHGTVSGIVVGGQFNTGYSPSFQFANPPPVVAGWSIPEDLDNGFVEPSQFQNPNIICHKGATNAGTSIKVTAGSTVELQWTPWPESHKGPVIDYLASCNGECETVDKTALKFFKIGEEGLLDNSNVPGNWASDKLIANNNTWVATIPADIAPGNYVLRHEIIALHSAYDSNGAQNYPQCINLIVSGSGTAKPAGVAGTELYKISDAGILIDIYKTLASYVIPGPALYSGGAAPAPVASSSAAGAVSTAAPVVSTTAAGVFPTAPSLPTAPFSNTSFTSAVQTAAPTVVVPEPSSVPTSVVDVPNPSGGNAGVPTPTAGQPDNSPTCNAAATVTVTAAGGAATVVSTVTVTAAAATVTVTAGAKPLPKGATLDDVLAWLGKGIKNVAGNANNGRRHARAIIA